MTTKDTSFEAKACLKIMSLTNLKRIIEAQCHKLTNIVIMMDNDISKRLISFEKTFQHQ